MKNKPTALIDAEINGQIRLIGIYYYTTKRF